MSYFRELPDLDYQSPLSDRRSSDEYVRMKNIFRRVKLRDDLKNVFTIFQKYKINDGERPDTVAYEIYGNPNYDWIILIIAGITNVRDQWPLSSEKLYQYSVDKYGEENLTSIHHYETTEVKDSKGRIIIPAGKIVDSNFSIPNPESPKEILYPVAGITNYEYEIGLNENKRLIFVLQKRYIQTFINDTRRIMTYGKSSQYVNDRLIKTENTRSTIL
jgi:hypothetical protein